MRPPVPPQFSLLLIALVLAILSGLAKAAPAGGGLNIQRIFPAGNDVSPGRQVVVSFSEPMVPLGAMHPEPKDVPVTITPAHSCEWRWLSPNELACNLTAADKLKPATRYTVTVASGTRSVEGAILVKPLSHTFTTTRPRLQRAQVRGWRMASWPVVEARFSLPVTRASVERHIFLTNSKGQRISLTAYPTLKAGHGDAAAGNGTGSAVVEQGARWYVTPISPLESDAAYTLRSEPGLASPTGPLRSAAARKLGVIHTFPPPKFLGVQCHSRRESRSLMVSPVAQSAEPIAAPDNAVTRRCDPENGIGLSFSTPVSRAELVRVLSIHAIGQVGAAEALTPWAHYAGTTRPRDSRADRSARRGYRPGSRYTLWLPKSVRASSSYSVILKDGALDALGRRLPGATLRFSTDSLRPRFHVQGTLAVLEHDENTDVALSTTNLERLNVEYATATAGSTKPGGKQRRVISPPPARDVSHRVPLGMRSMLDDQSGVVAGVVRSTTLPNGRAQEQTFFGQVTPFHVHAKLGHFRSIVWVTDMRTGESVAGATVSIYPSAYATLGLDHDDEEAAQARTARTLTDAQGLAILPGTESLDPKNTLSSAWGFSNTRLFVRVEKDDALGLIPLDSQFRAWNRTWDNDTWPSPQTEFGHLRVWGTTAQGVYRVGETIHHKIFVRNQNNLGLRAPPRGPYLLRVFDAKGQQVGADQSISLSEFGTFHGDVSIAKNAPVGWYRFEVEAPFANRKWTAMRVLISDFTPSPFAVEVTAPRKIGGQVPSANATPPDATTNKDATASPGIPVTEIPIEVAATLHSGGPFPNAAARIVTRVQPKSFRSTVPATARFHFGSPQALPGGLEVQRSEIALDSAGKHHLAAPLPTQRLNQLGIHFADVVVEGSVRDERGAWVSARRKVDYHSVDRLVGLRATRWLYHEHQPSTLEVVAVDAMGRPVSDTTARVVIERQVTRVARVKTAGNVYEPRYSYEWVRQGECNLPSGAFAGAQDAVPTAKGGLAAFPAMCTFTPNGAGAYRARATVAGDLASGGDQTPAGHVTELQFWVTGNSPVVWTQSDEGGLTILTEKEDYALGETAKFLVQNPLPGSKALITVERYGVIGAWVQEFAASTAVVEVPITPELLPGFYLSVVVTAPRVESEPNETSSDDASGESAAPASDPTLDLGQPVSRIGYVKVKTHDVNNRLALDVTTDKPIYRPGAPVTVNIAALETDERAKTTPVELAVVVVDEAVLALNQAGTAYYDVEDGLQSLAALDVRNYSILGQLIGRQKFETKGASPGGGGGSALRLRDNFSHLAHWTGAVNLDSDGNAQITFKAPDNLTGWRVLVLAVTPDERMSLSQANFKVNRPTELRPVVPNQVARGDQFTAGFSVLNRTEKTRTLDVVVRDHAAPDKVHYRGQVTIASYQRETVQFDLTASTAGNIRLRADAGDDEDQDAVVAELAVRERIPLIESATYVSTDQEETRIPLKVPAESRGDRGQLSVGIAPTVLGELDGAFRYMRNYPYQCWEQRLSKGTMASHFQRLGPYLPAALKWPEATTLATRTLSDAARFQAPSGGMTYWLAENRYVSPYLSAFTGLAFEWLRQQGHPIPEAVASQLDDYLLRLLREPITTNVWSGWENTTAYNVRAIALAALAFRGKVDAKELLRFRPHVANMTVFARAHLLQAAIQLNATDEIVAPLVDDILSHVSATGGKLEIHEVNGSQRMHWSQLRSSCAALTALVSTAKKRPTLLAGGDDLTSRVVRGILRARDTQPHWTSTQENLFCMQAVAAYAAVFEKDVPAIGIAADIDGESLGTGELQGRRAPVVALSRPIRPDDVGTARTMTVAKQGPGRMYITARVAFAPDPPPTAAMDAGFAIKRHYHVRRGDKWVELPSPYRVERGELIRVTLDVDVPATRHYVVIDDPVPGGLEPQNTDLATTSTTDANLADADASPSEAGGRRAPDRSWRPKVFYHRELRHHAARFFADYVPAGQYQLRYTAQAIAAGAFQVAATRVEEMYEPDVFGLSTRTTLSVTEGPRQ